MRKKDYITDDINIEKEAPILASIPKRNPYSVPEGYFDTLPHSIIEKCRESAAPVKSNIFWLFKPQWMIASLVLIVGFTFYLRSNPGPASLETLTAQVSDSAIYQNLQNNIDLVDVSSLEEVLPNDNFSTIEPATADSTNNQQDIENYLMNHNVDASDIENEL